MFVNTSLLKLQRLHLITIGHPLRCIWLLLGEYNVCLHSSELRLRREKLLELFKNAGNDLAEVDKEFNDYLRLYAGFIVEMDGKPSAAGQFRCRYLSL